MPRFAKPGEQNSRYCNAVHFARSPKRPSVDHSNRRVKEAVVVKEEVVAREEAVAKEEVNEQLVADSTNAHVIFLASPIFLGGGGTGGGGKSSSGGTTSHRTVPLGGSTKRGASPFSAGGGKISTIPSGQVFSGRQIGGGARTQVYGSSRYGSGYPYGGYGSYVGGRPFPFGFWPVYWG